MDLSILIVTYNSDRYIGQLLTYLSQEIRHLAAEIIVMDNQSRDQTTQIVSRDHPAVKLIASNVNLGFAAGNNLAAKHAQGRFLLLLNPDAMPACGSLELGVALMQANPQVGLSGGLLHDANGVLQPSARMFPRLRDELFNLSGLTARFPSSRTLARINRGWASPEQPAQVDWIPGAFVFIPTELFRSLGGFDERFFMYYEEVDLCRRIQDLGRTIQYWPQLRAMHIGGESAKTVKKAKVSRSGSQLESWRIRSGFLYYRKHHGWLSTWCLYQIEHGWFGLRSFKARWSVLPGRLAEFNEHRRTLKQAWRDTHGGRISPSKPW